jgi:hypothetical protein
MAAETQQINPRLAVALVAQLDAYCKEHRHSRGDVIEAALTAFLTPRTDADMMQVVLDGIREIRATQGAEVKLLTTITERLEAEAKLPQVPVAEWEEQYPVLRKAPVEEEPPKDEPPPIPPAKPRFVWWSRRGS